jgi:hypothetical protein
MDADPLQAAPPLPAPVESILGPLTDKLALAHWLQLWFTVALELE